MNSSSWERFTKRAREVLRLAQDEAKRLNHSYIGSEHLLIGLMREDGGVAGKVLRELGLKQIAFARLWNVCLVAKAQVHRFQRSNSHQPQSVC